MAGRMEADTRRAGSSQQLDHPLVVNMQQRPCPLLLLLAPDTTPSGHAHHLQLPPGVEGCRCRGGVSNVRHQFPTNSHTNRPNKKNENF